ncbi:unnamed protein product, partial [Durusdinium trenchii]
LCLAPLHFQYHRPRGTFCFSLSFAAHRPPCSACGDLDLHSAAGLHGRCFAELQHAHDQQWSPWRG